MNFFLTTKIDFSAALLAIKSPNIGKHSSSQKSNFATKIEVNHMIVSIFGCFYIYAEGCMDIS